MEGEEKGVKKQESLGVKLKIGALVGNRGGNTTPSPTWRFELPQEDDSRPQNLIFPVPTISARKLGANLWEVHPRSHQHHKFKKRAFDQPMMENQGTAERNDPATPLESPGSSSSVEMSPYRPEITRNGSPHHKGRSRDSSYNLKTSTEFVKVLNRIWSLEEQHASNTALMKAMKKELDHTRLLNKELLREKKRFHEEMDQMLRHVQVKDAVLSVRNEVEEERRLRKHSESLCDKLAHELSDVKSSYSNAVKELERERKARMLLEDLCDEFAKGIREYEREMHSRKSRFGTGWTTQDRLILHLSEAWLDERMQMKLAETRSGVTDEDTIVDKLSLEIEAFLKTQKSQKPSRRKLRGCSLESFHLMVPGSAPQNEINEEGISNLKTDAKNGPFSDHTKKKPENAVLVSQTESEEQLDGIMEPKNEHKTRVPDPEVLESSSRWSRGAIKENTLKAKLLEARLESRNSSSRISKVPLAP